MPSIKSHRFLAVLSFIVLASVLYYLTYNTFELKNEGYLLNERKKIKDLYSDIIHGDKVYPGGNSLMDPLIEAHKFKLEALYRTDPAAFNVYRHLICDSIFTLLKTHNPMDSIFNAMKKGNGLESSLEYTLTVQSINLMFHVGERVPLYAFGNGDDGFPTSKHSADGIVIGGKLKTPSDQNKVSRVNVSSGASYSYEMSFCLHVDSPHRTSAILKLMLPTLLLSLFSILCVVYIYYVTYSNWLKQKKLAEMKTDFVNSITHEFHTPLSTIMVANKSLQKDQILSNKAKVKSLTEVVYRQSKRLETLFGQVLDITRMENINLEKEEVPLGKLVNEIIQDYQLKIRDKSTHLFFSANGTKEYMVSLNRFWFTTMLFNIFDNAIKYNDKNDKKIKVEVLVHKGGPELRISDNGVGMEEETVKYIFDKFYRANKRQMTQVPGLGLGLYYARQCIHIHGWKMQVDSKVDVGSNFSIFIS